MNNSLQAQDKPSFNTSGFKGEIPDFETQVKENMREVGIRPPEQILFDEKIHRFPTNEKSNDTAGWYIFFKNSIPAGTFGIGELM